jgi:hypothetical protein
MEQRRFGSVLVRIFEDTRYLETVFPDGTKVPAAPHDTDSYRAQAEALCYTPDADGCWQMCRDHEIGHTLLTQTLGLEHSPSLWAVAHGTPNHTEISGEMWAEEELVLAFQRWRKVRHEAI